MTRSESRASADHVQEFADWATPGRRTFAAGAAWEAVSTAASIGLWGAISALVFAVLRARPDDALWAAAGIAVAGLAVAGARRLAAAAADRGRERVAAALRKRLITAALPDEATSHPVRDGAEAAATLQEQVDDIAEYLAASIPLRLASGLSMGLILLAVAVVHWPVAIILLLATTLMPLNLSLAGRSAQDASERRLDEMRRLSAVVLESFHGMATLRALRATGRRRTDLAVASERLESATISVLRWAFISSVIMDVLITFSIATCATYVGLDLLDYIRVPVAPELDLFSGLWVLTLVPLYFVPVRRAAASFHQRDRARAAAGPVISMLGEVSSVAADSTAAVPLESAPTVAVSALTLQHVGAPVPVLDEVTFRAEAGAWTAVVGPSGAGKTTLLRVLSGILPAGDGVVQWVTDADDSREPDLREAVWIGQRTVVLDGTIAENIRLGRASASDAEVRAAAEVAGLSAMLARLPRGLDTRVGDGGVGVSAGEARRIAVARGALKGARIWFLDEPTAHLDAETEAAVLSGLRRATAGATVIAATHSALLMAQADAVWELSDGRLAVAEVAR